MQSSTDDCLHGCNGPTSFQQRFLGQLRSVTMRNTKWTLSAQTLQLAGRFGYFVIIAHVLAPAGYGTFVACTALIAVLSPFASCGSEKVLVKCAARDRNTLPVFFGNALLLTAGFGSLLILFAVCIRPIVLPSSASLSMLLAVGIADLLGRQTVEICLNAYTAVGEFRRYAQLVAWSTGMRLIAAVFLAVAVSTATALHWAYLYAGATLIAALTGVAAVIRYSGPPRLRVNLVLPSIREGFHFSTSQASQSVYNDIDKTMLARLSTVDAAALYAVAYRFVDAATLPIASVAAAAYPEFFRRGTEGVTRSFEFAKGIVRRSVIYGVIVALVLFAGAGVVPRIMGTQYAEAVTVLRWLCVLPAIRSVHHFLTDTLTGADYQWQRSLVQIAAAAFNILINLWIIRAFAWRGAAWSSVATDLLLAILLYLVILAHLRREQAEGGRIAARSILATGEQ